MTVPVISGKDSKAWMEGAIALVKSLGGVAAPCATINDPDRYSLRTRYGEVRISVINVFEEWLVPIHFREPSRAPFEVLPHGDCRWVRPMDWSLETALSDLEKDLRSWL